MEFNNSNTTVLKGTKNRTGQHLTETWKLHLSHSDRPSPAIPTLPAH